MLSRPRVQHRLRRHEPGKTPAQQSQGAAGGRARARQERRWSARSTAVAGRVANQFLPPLVEGYAKKGVPLYPYNPAKAQSLLREAGLTLPVTLEFWYPTERPRGYMPDPPRNFQAFAASLEKSGFKITPHPAPWRGGYVAGLQGGRRRSTCSGGPVTSVTRPTSSTCTSASQTAQFGFNNPALFNLLQRADAESEPRQAHCAVPGGQRLGDEAAADGAVCATTPGARVQEEREGLRAEPGRDRALQQGFGSARTESRPADDEHAHVSSSAGSCCSSRSCSGCRCWSSCGSARCPGARRRRCSASERRPRRSSGSTASTASTGRSTSSTGRYLKTTASR